MARRHVSMKTSFLLSAAGLVMLGSGQAMAADAAAADAVPAASDAAPADQIVVTAQRRNQSIQDVPFTLQALSGTALSELNVTNFNDLLKYTPNVTFASNGPGQGAIFMRGLSTGFAGNQSSGTIAPFPNVALYLDDQSMQFPARNADVYVADLERIEVLEGPQGTLFGGGAEAGAVRYITAKPKIGVFSGHFEGSVGGTVSGGPNGSFNATINIPVTSTVAVRATIYDDHHGGYIDNVPSAFTRRATDTGAVAYNFVPNANNQANSGQYNNFALAKKDYNPLDYTGGRVEALWDVTPDWNVLVTESYQHVDAEGTFASYPTGSDFQPLKALETTTFSPSYNKDTYWNTAWTVNGKLGDWKVVYTGSYLTRHIEDQQDYANYSRTPGGMYYQCTGSATGFGTGSTYCYSPAGFWHDNIRNTHHSEELRLASPEGKRIRVIGGAYYEKYNIEDIMRFSYETIPSCTNSLITQGAGCVGVVQTYPGSTANQPGLQPPGVAFGEDTQRGYRQYAFFGSADFDILPNLTITGGTRYYNYNEFEKGSQFETYAGNCYQVVVCAVAGSGNVNIDANNDHVTYHGFKSKGVITWKPQPGTMIYGLFSQGFRPGGFNRATKLILPGLPYGTAATLPAGSLTTPTYQLIRANGYTPDTLTNWEVGLKTDLFDHKVTFNLSGYYMVWENVQIAFFNPNGGFGNTSFVTNGANFHVKGLEAQLAARPTAGLSFQAGATYNTSKQVSTPCFVSNNPGSPTLGQCITQYYAKNNPVAIVPTSPFGKLGDSLPYSPHFQANLRGRYEWQGPIEAKWYISGGVSYTGAVYNQPSTYPSGDGVAIPGTTLLRYRIPGYASVDASIGFKHDNYSVSIFGENLTNTHASTFTSSAQFIKSEVPVRPLTYGLKVSADF